MAEIFPDMGEMLLFQRFKRASCSHWNHPDTGCSGWAYRAKFRIKSSPRRPLAVSLRARVYLT